MLDNIQKLLHHPVVSGLRDIRSLGLIVFACIVLLVSWSGVKAIQSNYKLQQELSRLEQENTIQQLKNNNQKLRNEYYQTPQYLELAARQNFGLAAPGEKILVVPKEVALARVAGMAKVAGVSMTTAADNSEAQKRQPFYQRNMQAWIDFFLHRGVQQT